MMVSCKISLFVSINIYKKILSHTKCGDRFKEIHFREHTFDCIQYSCIIWVTSMKKNFRLLCHLNWDNKWKDWNWMFHFAQIKNVLDDVHHALLVIMPRNQQKSRLAQHHVCLTFAVRSFFKKISPLTNLPFLRCGQFNTCHYQKLISMVLGTAGVQQYILLEYFKGLKRIILFLNLWFISMKVSFVS